MRPRREHKVAQENVDRWLISYSDFITLLFAFFTTMYAISNVDAQKLGKMVLSLQAAFDASVFPAANSKVNLNNSGTGQPVQPNAVYPNFVNNKMLDATKPTGKLSAEALAKAQRESLERIRQDLSTLIMDDTLQDKVKILLKNRGVVVSLAEAGFFDSGSDTVRPASMPLLDKMGRYIKKLPNFIRVEGHTDNVPIHTARFPSNWELSTARATFIVAHLIRTHAFDPGRLSAAGYGEFHPVDSNDTIEGRARNRRVDIVIMAPTAMAQEPDSDLPEFESATTSGTDK